MLRASRDILRPGGLISFLVIATPPDRPVEAGDLAPDVGPEYVEAGDGYSALMEEAEFADTEIVDVSAEYKVTLAAWIREWDAESKGLQSLVGEEEFAERQAARRRSLDAIETGLLGRYLISARRPDG